MICFDVELNGKRLCRAGVGEEGVLSAIVSWVGRSPESPRPGGRTAAGATELTVGGLFNPQPEVHAHPEWVRQPLKSGDEVTIRLVRAEVADTPAKVRSRTDEEIREQQRQYYLNVKAQFEPNDGS